MRIRPAKHTDVPAMVRLIGHYASEGLMLPRSSNAIAAALPEYVVADVEGELVGCGAIQQYSDESAEIYGLATYAQRAPRGTGTAIVEALIEKARADNISRVFAMTLAPAFFQKIGFHTVQHRDVPLKVWKDCVACPKFGNCDEIAMVLEFGGKFPDRPVASPFSDRIAAV
jgi:amino-acid N-acetyltransferase